MLRPLPTVLLALLLPLLVALGLWQLQRAAEKDVLLARHARQQAMAPTALESVLGAGDPAWRHVRLQGWLDAEHSLLLDNSSREGHAGVELLQPFIDQASGLWLLLNRGWLPWPDRRQLPVYTTPGTQLELQAWVYVPPGAAFHLRADPLSNEWPRLITAVDPPRLWAELGRDGYAHELRLMPGPAALRVDWPVVNLQPAIHRGYAVQWFALAAVLAGLYLYLGFTVGAGKAP